ncbi:MAG: FAD:protein FMN transferase [Bacteroidota bacterium]
MKDLPALLFASLALVLVSCEYSAQPVLIEHAGSAQGSTYQIKYLAPDEQNLRVETDSIFARIDYSMSTYAPTSLISQVNRGDTWVHVDSLFMTVLRRALEIAEETHGDFDPTIGPLVNLWGFGPQEKRRSIEPDTVRRVMARTGYGAIQISDEGVSIPAGFTIDFNAIAQGFTVDVIAAHLEQKGLTDYMVEVGGEVRTRGTNDRGNVWRIGLDKPADVVNPDDRFQVILELKDSGLATSGSYRNFWVDEETGMRYAHTIDPQTGYPANNTLLSATILAPSAMDADAYSTACMVKGLEECKTMLQNKADLEGYLVFGSENGSWGTFTTAGFEAYIAD